MAATCASSPLNAPMMLPDHNANKPLPSAFRAAIHPSIADRLDPSFVKLYNDHIANAPLPSTDLHSVRQNYSSLYAYATAPATGVGGIGETQVPGWEKYPGDINVRVYVPPGEEPGLRKVWPVHFNFHGGGWVVGDLETSAHICHHICATVPCCVIDIEYRLVPEYPFPIGIMDSLAAVTHILANHNTFSIDPANVTLGGESSGATIALVLCHLLRDLGYGKQIQGVAVGTPTISDVRKYVTPDQSPWPSVREFEHAPTLDWQRIKWFDTFKWMSLASSHDPVTNEKGTSRATSAKEKQQDVSWFANAINAPNFRDLSPLTWIGTAEIDPLRDEAEAYAKKCEENGNRVILKRFTGVPHPFMRMDKFLPQGRDYVEDVIRHLRMCLYKPQPKVENAAPATQTVTKSVEMADA